jgi:hypothetical protein
MRDLNPRAAADGQGSYCFKCPFLHLLVLSVVFLTFLKIKTSNKKYTLKNEFFYLLCKFQENPPIFMQLSRRSFFILFVFHFKLHFLDVFFSNSSCCKQKPCAIKFGADCTCHHIPKDIV